MYQSYFTNLVVGAYMLIRQTKEEKGGIAVNESRLKDFIKAMLVLNALNLAYICLFLAISLIKFEHKNYDEFEAGKPARYRKQLIFLVVKILLNLSTLVNFFFFIAYTIYY